VKFKKIFGDTNNILLMSLFNIANAVIFLTKSESHIIYYESSFVLSIVFLKLIYGACREAVIEVDEDNRKKKLDYVTYLRSFLPPREETNQRSEPEVFLGAPVLRRTF